MVNEKSVHKKNPHHGSSLKDVIKEAKKSPKFRKAWEDQEGYFRLLELMVSARKKSGITQEKLAERLGIKQPVLSRLEHGAYKKASMETLQKVADALGFNIVVTLAPKKRGAA
ncbi:MAG: helix-turn-helix domain-containing protein [Nitrospinae bacterium]|nr:helix-turn-helix domain-containing protein [Nitrospinota bacterium]